MPTRRPAARTAALILVLVLFGLLAYSVSQEFFPFSAVDGLGFGMGGFAEGMLGALIGLVVAAAAVVIGLVVAALAVTGVGLLLLWVIGVVVLAVLGALVPILVPVAVIVLAIWALCRRPQPKEAVPPAGSGLPPSGV